MPNSANNNDNRWHLRQSVPIGIIGALLIQGASFIWYGAQLDAKVQQTSYQVQLLESWRMKQDDQLSNINSHQSTIDQKLDDLSSTLHHTDDIIERYFYRTK